MTSITEDFLFQLLTFLTIASGNIIGVTISLTIKPIPPETQVSNWKIRIFRETCVYSILPIILTLVLNSLYLYKLDSIFILAASLVAGLIGKPLTKWFTELNNVINLIKAIAFGAKGAKERLSELNELQKDLKADKDNDEDSGGGKK